MYYVQKFLPESLYQHYKVMYAATHAISPLSTWDSIIIIINFC